MVASKRSILGLNVELAEIGAANSLARFVAVSTPASAMDQLRKHSFDLVIVRVLRGDDENESWLMRLRAARPVLPAVVLHDSESLPSPREVSLRTAGVTAVFCSRTRELQVWLSEWLKRQATNGTAH